MKLNICYLHLIEWGQIDKIVFKNVMLNATFIFYFFCFKPLDSIGWDRDFSSQLK